jgi:hypothetical protein
LYLARDYANSGTTLFIANFGGRTVTIQSNSSFVGRSSAPSTFNLQANGIAHLMLMAKQMVRLDDQHILLDRNGVC